VKCSKFASYPEQVLADFEHIQAEGTTSWKYQLHPLGARCRAGTEASVAEVPEPRRKVSGS
jgi:hypothetical protein